MINARRVKQLASEAGFDICGIALARELSDSRRFFGEWLLNGYDAGLGYMSRNIDKRFSPALLVPGTVSVVVCGVIYKNDTSLGGYENGTPKVASYARSTDYHRTVKDMLFSLAGMMSSEFGKMGFRAFTDSAPVLEKRWAYEAGLGFIGRNRLLVSPEFGSFLLLGELLVDVEADEYDEPYSGAGCGACRRCVEACPNGALTEHGLDARRCISRLTIEDVSCMERPTVPYGDGAYDGCVAENVTGVGGSCDENGKTIRSEMSVADSVSVGGDAVGASMSCPHCGESELGGDSDKPVASYCADCSHSADMLHGWIFGCDECQSVCPYNRMSPFYRNPRFAPVFDPRDMTVGDWLSIDERAFAAGFAATPLQRSGLERIKTILERRH